MKTDYSIVMNVQKISGIVFYAFEHYIFLKENNIICDLIYKCNLTTKKKIIELFYEKYDYSFLEKYKITFSKKNQLIICENCIVFDFFTMKHLSRIAYLKNLYYNYTNTIDSLKILFKDHPLSKKRNIIPFGDHELIKDQTIFNYSLCLNFKIFKKITFKKSVFVERPKKEEKNKTIFKNFHSNFNKCIIEINPEFFDRANRLIPECKYYNKEIQIIYPTDLNKKYFDSIDTRKDKSWEEMDINSSNFIDILQK